MNAVRRTLRVALGVGSPIKGRPHPLDIAAAWFLIILVAALVVAAAVGGVLDVVAGRVPWALGVAIGCFTLSWWLGAQNKQATRRRARVAVGLLAHRHERMPVNSGGFVVLHYSTCTCGRGVALLVGDRQIDQWLKEAK